MSFIVEGGSTPDEGPSVTISHHPLPVQSSPAYPVAHYSHNSNNSVAFQYTNEAVIEDDLSSQPGIVIEHMGPGSILSSLDHNTSGSRTLLIDKNQTEIDPSLEAPLTSNDSVLPVTEVSPI